MGLVGPIPITETELVINLAREVRGDRIFNALESAYRESLLSLPADSSDSFAWHRDDSYGYIMSGAHAPQPCVVRFESRFFIQRSGRTMFEIGFPKLDVLATYTRLNCAVVMAHRDEIPFLSLREVLQRYVHPFMTHFVVIALNGNCADSLSCVNDELRGGIQE